MNSVKAAGTLTMVPAAFCVVKKKKRTDTIQALNFKHFQSKILDPHLQPLTEIYWILEGFYYAHARISKARS